MAEEGEKKRECLLLSLRIEEVGEGKQTLPILFLFSGGEKMENYTRKGKGMVAVHRAEEGRERKLVNSS